MEKPLLRRFVKKFFIALNFILAVFFLAGAYVKYFTPAGWWFLGLFTFILAYLLIALVLFFIFWLFKKSFWFCISLITILLGWQAVINIFPVNLSSPFTMQKKPGSIRVMSWNVEQFNILHHKDHPEVKQEMFDLINKYDPDIACFQEVVAGDKKKGINYFPDIQKALRFIDYFYSYSLKDDFDVNHHFGRIIFSKLPIINKQTVVNYPNDYNATFQYIDVLSGSDTIRVFNIHLQSLKFTPQNLSYLDNSILNSDSNITESKSIISKIKTGFIKRSIQANFIKDEINHSPYPVIVCGDFNDVPNSYAYETIGAGLQNAFVEKGAGIARTFSTISPTLRIDNIFTDKDFTVTQFTRVKKLLSDHFPIIADLIPPQNTK
ncbi:MAG: endonuclease/exonuclease/phosphatase family protein [Ginsengibacter sp.]